MEEIPPELILNWDQTGIKIVPTTTWTMEQCKTKRVEFVETNDKRQITAVFCGTIQGAFLSLQLFMQVTLHSAIQNLIFCLVGTSLNHQIIGQ